MAKEHNNIIEIFAYRQHIINNNNNIYLKSNIQCT